MWLFTHESSRVYFVCTASVIDVCRPDDFSLPQIGMSETQSTIHRRTPTPTDRYVHTQTHDQTEQEAAQHTIVLEERAQTPLYNTHTIQSTSLDRNSNYSSQQHFKIKVPSERENKRRKKGTKKKKKTPGAATLSFKGKPRARARTCRFVSQTQKKKVQSSTTDRKKHYARLMPPGFSSLASRSH